MINEQCKNAGESPTNLQGGIQPCGYTGGTSSPVSIDQDPPSQTPEGGATGVSDSADTARRVDPVAEHPLTEDELIQHVGCLIDIIKERRWEFASALCQGITWELRRRQLEEIRKEQEQEK